jgi:sulfatase modifying factor 1
MRADPTASRSKSRKHKPAPSSHKEGTQKGDHRVYLALLLIALLCVTAWVTLTALRGNSSKTAFARSEYANTAATLFEPTVLNNSPAPGGQPEGMVWVPGGEFCMGVQTPLDTNAAGMRSSEDARPVHRVYVDGFFIDKTDVTNAQFAVFVKEAGYVTVAEREPRAEGARSQLAPSARAKE